jgi:hypothetical protein
VAVEMMARPELEADERPDPLGVIAMTELVLS